jgi:anti-sigma B factor antagonist
VDLTITASRLGAWEVLSVQGELDLYTSPALLERVRASDDGSSVALDLTEVSFIDSSGLGAMVASLKHTKERGGRLALVAPETSAAERLLGLTGLDRIMTLSRTLQDLQDVDEVAGVDGDR